MKRESVTFLSNGDSLSGVLFLADSKTQTPSLILCHGAFEYKEAFFEIAEYLAGNGIGAVAIDMHGHGESDGERFHVDMHEWARDIQAAVTFLESHPGIDSNRIGAFGFSSGGTAVLEAALVEKRLKVLITLDATVRNILSSFETLAFQLLNMIGKIKYLLTKKDLRVPLAHTTQRIQVACNPEVNQAIISDKRLLEGYSAFPLPGAAQSVIVDTLKRVHQITIPTLVLHGENDRVDPPETARILFNALTCDKRLEILPNSGHAGHMDFEKYRVMQLTLEWVLQHLL